MTRRILATLALTAAAGTASLAMAGSASADNGGWYKTSAACQATGHQAIHDGYHHYRCSYVSTHKPHWHLILS
ncbi:MAG: hypothetical protein QM638_06900 [Nocardioides sp.]|uniref:hypothetical protein n=1 Tax=Nocardioides sp. TaxID=35761 RepID=UPI0039E546F7